MEVKMVLALFKCENWVELDFIVPNFQGYVRSTITDLGEIMEQIGLTIRNIEEITQKTQKTMALLGQGQIMETIGLTLLKPNWALTLKIMGLLTQGPETILPFQVDKH